MDEIDLAEQIGKGGFGMVYKGTWRGAPVAVKCGPCANNDQEALERSLREVRFPSLVSHGMTSGSPTNSMQTFSMTRSLLPGSVPTGHVPIQVVLAKHMSHPNVVQTYAWTLLTNEQADAMVSSPTGDLHCRDSVMNDKELRLAACRRLQCALSGQHGLSPRPHMLPASAQACLPATPSLWQFPTSRQWDAHVPAASSHQCLGSGPGSGRQL